jgi:ABC-type transporter Mla subunit MlaD
MRTANPGAKVRMSDINIGSVVGTTDINAFNSKVQQLMDTTVTDVIAATAQEIRSK